VTYQLCWIMIAIDNAKIHNKRNNIKTLISVKGLILLVWLRNFIFSILCITVQLLSFKLTVLPN